MSTDKFNVEQRIQNSVYGTPKVKPDEQRKYLGTFRERVWLTITVAEVKQQDWSTALRTELTAHPKSLVIINGNLADQFTHNYVLIASQQNAEFTIKTGTDTKTNDDSFAVVVADHQAVYQSPVDVVKKYGQQSNPPTTNQRTKPSLIKRLFHL